QALSETGMRCDIRVQAEGINGADQDECKKYLDAMLGNYFKNTMAACQTLLKWYENKRQFVISHPSYASTDVDSATKLVKAMKAIQASCSPDNYHDRYPYLTQPLDHIRALSEMK
ncbi:MAG: hypothetical protein V4493_05685, partial [Pseudomonadota bacterium]